MEKPHKKLDAWRGAVNLTVDNAVGAARQTKKEFVNYLHIAQASLSELDTQLEIATRLKFLTERQWRTLDGQINHIDKLLSCLIKYLKVGRSPYPSPLTPYR